MSIENCTPCFNGSFDPYCLTSLGALSVDPTHLTCLMDQAPFERSGNRLRENLDGSFEIIPKSPAYVVGEQVIRPTIDLTHTLFRALYDGTWGAYSYAKSFFSSKQQQIQEIDLPKLDELIGTLQKWKDSVENRLFDTNQHIEEIFDVLGSNQIDDVRFLKAKLAFTWNEMLGVFNDIHEFIKEYDVKSNDEIQYFIDTTKQKFSHFKILEGDVESLLTILFNYHIQDQIVEINAKFQTIEERIIEKSTRIETAINQHSDDTNVKHSQTALMLVWNLLHENLANQKQFFSHFKVNSFEDYKNFEQITMGKFSEIESLESDVEMYYLEYCKLQEPLSNAEKLNPSFLEKLWAFLYSDNP